MLLEKDDTDSSSLAVGTKPQLPLPFTAGIKACTYTLPAFGMFWFARTIGVPELLAGAIGLAASFAVAWYDAKLAWQPFQESRRQLID